MSIVSRFLTSFRDTEVDPLVPGLIQRDDGSVWVVAPDGTESQIGGGFSQRTLTINEVKGLPSTPVELVATPGPGKMLWPADALLVCDSTLGAFSNFSPDVQIAVHHADTTPDYFLAYAKEAADNAVVSILLASGALIAVPLGTIGWIHALHTATLGHAIADVWEDRPLVIDAANGLGDFTGHGAPVLVSVRYSIIDLT